MSVSFYFYYVLILFSCLLDIWFLFCTVLPPCSLLDFFTFPYTTNSCELTDFTEGPSIYSTTANSLKLNISHIESSLAILIWLEISQCCSILLLHLSIFSLVFLRSQIPKLWPYCYFLKQRCLAPCLFQPCPKGSL